MTTNNLHQEYIELDKKLTEFRKHWNRQARKDIEHAKKTGVSKGAQGDFPEWWYEDVARWRDLRTMLNIRR